MDLTTAASDANGTGSQLSKAENATMHFTATASHVNDAGVSLRSENISRPEMVNASPATAAVKPPAVNINIAPIQSVDALHQDINFLYHLAK